MAWLSKSKNDNVRRRGGGISTTAPRRRVSDENFRVGRTFAGDAQKTREAKKERVAAQRRRKTKNIATVISVLLIVIALVAAAIGLIVDVVREREELTRQATAQAEPTVAIIDENTGDNVSTRTKTFVARLEADVKEQGYKIDHVVLPYQKVREIDVYIQGRTEYYKMSLDRGSAVQAEDMARMVLYLDEKELSPTYVDLRVEGKAYYK